MIRGCGTGDHDAILEVINDAARAYQGIIPADRWKEPYMPDDELHHEIENGVLFWGYEDGGELVGVMGVQHVRDVTLIRHAYVATARQNRGIGGALLAFLRRRTTDPVLVGTWAAAEGAIRFYRRHGFEPVSGREKDRLLRTYWSIPERQIITSIVLADRAWFAARRQTTGPL